jgi:hypothetical protein
MLQGFWTERFDALASCSRIDKPTQSSWRKLYERRSTSRRSVVVFDLSGNKHVTSGEYREVVVGDRGGNREGWRQCFQKLDALLSRNGGRE